MMTDSNSSVVPLHLFANTSFKSGESRRFNTKPELEAKEARLIDIHSNMSSYVPEIQIDGGSNIHFELENSDENNKISSVQKRMSITLGMKLQILQAVDMKKVSKKEIAKAFGIRPSTLSTIIKNRNLIENIARSGSLSPFRKKFRGSNYSELENALLHWYRFDAESNESMNITQLTDKANELADTLGIAFRANKSWIQRFKDRHGIMLGRSVSDVLISPLFADNLDTETVESGSCQSEAHSKDQQSNDLSETRISTHRSNSDKVSVNSEIPYSANGALSEDTGRSIDLLANDLVNTTCGKVNDKDLKICGQKYTKMTSIPPKFTHKRRAITLKTKLEVINAVEEGIHSKSDIARFYNLPPSTLSTILKDKFVIKKLAGSGFQAQFRMKCRNATYSDIDNALYDWVKESNKFDNVSTVALIKKADQLASDFGILSFKANYSWVTRFRLRRGISVSSRKKKTYSKFFTRPVSTEEGSDTNCDNISKHISDGQTFQDVASTNNTAVGMSIICSGQGFYDTNTEAYRHTPPDGSPGKGYKESQWHLPNIKQEHFDPGDEPIDGNLSVPGFETHIDKEHSVTRVGAHQLKKKPDPPVIQELCNKGYSSDNSEIHSSNTDKQRSFTNRHIPRRIQLQGRSKMTPKQITSDKERDVYESFGHDAELCHHTISNQSIGDEISQKSTPTVDISDTEIKQEMFDTEQESGTGTSQTSSSNYVLSCISDIRTYLEGIKETPNQFFEGLCDIEHFIKSRYEDNP